MAPLLHRAAIMKEIPVQKSDKCAHLVANYVSAGVHAQKQLTDMYG